MPIMTCVGKTAVNEGKIKNGERKGENFKMQDAHFSGTSLGVEGVTVAKVTLDLLKEGDRLPAIEIGGRYIVEQSDKGFLRNLERLDAPASPAPSASDPAVPAAPQQGTRIKLQQPHQT